MIKMLDCIPTYNNGGAGFVLLLVKPVNKFLQQEVVEEHVVCNLTTSTDKVSLQISRRKFKSSLRTSGAMVVC